MPRGLVTLRDAAARYVHLVVRRPGDPTKRYADLFVDIHFLGWRYTVQMRFSIARFVEDKPFVWPALPDEGGESHLGIEQKAKRE